MAKKAKPTYADSIRTLDPPKTKKDGTPWRSWKDESDERAAKALARREAGLPPRNARRPCQAQTTGVHGPKRPCGNYAVPGLTVCRMHGGNTKAAKAAARRRLVDELDPTISRLIELRDQDEHLPTALGASVGILNRVMGKPGNVDADKGAGKATIIVGVAIGGIPQKSDIVVGAALPGAQETEATEDDGDYSDIIDGETVDREGE